MRFLVLLGSYLSESVAEFHKPNVKIKYQKRRRPE